MGWLRLRSATLRWIGGALAFLTIGRLAVAEELVLHRFSSDTPSAQIEEILYLSAGVELVEAGISSSRDAGAEAADYILNTDYRIAGESLYVEYRLERTESPESETEASELSMTVSLDSDLDRNLAHEIERLLAAAQVERSPNEEARIVEYSQAPAEPTDPPPMDEPDQPEQGDQQGRRDLPQQEPDVPEEPELRERVAAEPDHRHRARLAASGGAVFPVGEGRDMFRIGLAGGVRVGIGRTRGAARITWGGDVALYRLFPDRGVSGGVLDIATVGPAIGVRFGGPDSVGVSGGLSAGLAAVSVADSGARLTKMTPYAAGRVAADVAVGSWVSLGFGVHSFAVYEASLPVFGIVPEMRIVLKL